MPVTTRHVLTCTTAGAGPSGDFHRKVETLASHRKVETTGGPTLAMAQELEALSARVESLTDQVTGFSQLLAYTAGTRDAPPNSIVKLDFLNQSLQVLSGNVLAAIDLDHARLLAANREIRDLKQVVQENNDVTRRLIDEEQSTSTRTREHLEMGLR